MTKFEKQSRTEQDWFRWNDPKDRKRLLDYLNARGQEFKREKGFLKAYDKEGLPSLVSRVTRELRKSESGRSETRSSRQIAKERIIPKWALEKFIEIREERERAKDAAGKREKRAASRGSSQN